MEFRRREVVFSRSLALRRTPSSSLDHEYDVLQLLTDKSIKAILPPSHCQSVEAQLSVRNGYPHGSASRDCTLQASNDPPFAYACKDGRKIWARSLGHKAGPVYSMSVTARARRIIWRVYPRKAMYLPKICIKYPCFLFYCIRRTCVTSFVASTWRSNIIKLWNNEAELG